MRCLGDAAPHDSLVTAPAAGAANLYNELERLQAP